MNDNKYEVYIDTQLIASNMTIDTAMILCKALFEKYYNDHRMTVMIQEMERAELCSRQEDNNG